MADPKDVAKATAPAEGTAQTQTAKVTAPPPVESARVQYDRVLANIEALKGMKIPVDKILTDKLASLSKKLDKEKLEARYGKSKAVVQKAIEQIVASIELPEDGTNLSFTVSVGKDEATGKACIASIRVGGARKASAGGGGGAGTAFGGQGCTINGTHHETGAKALAAFTEEYIGKSVNAHALLERAVGKKWGIVSYERDPKVEKAEA